jgi:hypothetical protein
MVGAKVVDGYILIRFLMQVDLLEVVVLVDHPLMGPLTLVVGVIFIHFPLPFFPLVILIKVHRVDGELYMVDLPDMLVVVEAVVLVLVLLLDHWTHPHHILLDAV